MAAANAPSASLVVYEAPNNTGDASALDLFQRIASDDAAKVVTTSWGDCESLIPQADLQAEHTIFGQMALQGQTMIASSGDSGSEDCFPDPAHSTALAVDDPGSQPNVLSTGGTSLTAASASAQSVWNNCSGQPTNSCAVHSLTGGSVGSTGGGLSKMWPRDPSQPAPSPVPAGACTNPQGCRAVPDLVYPSDPGAGSVVAYFSGALGGWTAFGGTSVAAPSTAGYLADVNQGCAATLGDVDPALYAAATGNSSDFTLVTSGNNDFTGTNGGAFTASTVYNAASGLGSAVDQNLLASLQGGAGCPSVAALGPNTGPVGGGNVITIFGGGLADASAVSFGVAGQGQIVGRSATTLSVIPPASASRSPRPSPTMATAGTSPADGAIASSPPTAASSPSAPPSSTAPPAVSSSTGRSSAWRPPRARRATGWSPPTAASSPSATPSSTVPWAADP
jgi:hypothetical protein